MPILPDASALGPTPIPKAAGNVVSYKANTGTETLPGQAMAGAGQSLERLSMAIQEQQYRNDTLRAEDAYNQLRVKQLDLTTGEGGFARLKGGDAVNQPVMKDYSQKFDDSFKGMSDGLANDRQRELFRRRYDVANLQYKHDILNHVAQQQNVYAAETYKSGVNVETEDAAQRYKDPSAIGMSLQRVNGLVSQEAVRQGVKDTDVETVMRRDAVSGVHVRVIENMLADDKVADAKTYFELNKDQEKDDAGNLIRGIDTKSQLALEHMFKARQAQDTGEARTLLQQKLQDANAMASRGISPPNGFIDEGLIQTAYPNKDVHADQVRRQVGLMYRTANDVASLKTKNNAELVDFVTKAREPSAARPDLFSEEARIQDHLKAQAAHIITEREARPMTYAAENGIGASNPIDASNPKSVLKEIPNRIQTAYTMSHMFGSPFMPLEKQEAAQVGRQVDAMTYKDKVDFFDQLHQSANDAHGYQAVVQAIRPDSPVTGIVGVLMGKAHEAESPAPPVPGFGFSDAALGIPQAGPSVKSRSVVVNTHMFGQDETMDARSVATMIAKGEDILNPMKADKQSDGKPKLFKMPPEEQLRQKWTDTVGDAYGGNRDAEEHSYQAYRAFYAAAAVQGRLPDTAADGATTQRAALAVSGGVYEVGGQKVLLPWGMNADQFKANLNAQWPSIKERIGKPNAEFSDIKLMSAPKDGQYVVFAGTGPVYDRQGRPIIIQVSP